MKRLLFLLTLLCTLSLTVSAAEKEKKEQKLELWGQVFDSFTRGKVKAFVTVMTQDSTVVDTCTCETSETRSYSYYDIELPKQSASYIFKATAEGYEDTYMQFNVDYNKRRKFYPIPDILMKKKQEDIYKDVDLDGVVVKGTKIRVAYKGDTIVYDASAFKMPEGSMLDGLIKQLPGAELKDNGDIYINGKKIDYLTLNGKDFYKGDNKVMLENLPYFTVKDIKVFNKDSEKSQLTGKMMEKKDYVMDVTLKREYARGYIANAEAGVGSENRWMGRLFGLYYDDHTRVSTFFNANNVNETRQPGSDGNWNSNKDNGLVTTKQAGVNINTESKDKTVQYDAAATVKWNDAENESRSFTETYSDVGSIFRNNSSWSNNKNFAASMNHRFATYNEEKTSFMQIYSRVNFSNNKNWSENSDSTYTTTLTNRNSSKGFSKTRRFDINGSMYAGHRFAQDDMILFIMNAYYNTNKPTDNFSREMTYYVNTGNTDLRARYNDSHNTSYSFSPELSFQYQLPASLSLTASTEFTQQKQDIYYQKYDLERLEEARNQAIDWLPSAREDMARAYDNENSYSYKDLRRDYQGSLSLSKGGNDSWMQIKLPYTHTTERMDYVGNGLDTIARRTYNRFNPRIYYYSYGKHNPEVNLSYNMNTSVTSFYSLLPKKDTSNPLYTRINNPNVKDATTHNYSVYINFKNDTLTSNVFIGLDGSFTVNAQGNRTAYNAVTGAYTTMRDNIDGNWNANLYGGWNRPLNKEKTLRMYLRGGVDYNRSVDFANYTYTESGDDDIMKAPISKVDNVNLNGYLKFNYNKGDLSASLFGEIKSRHTRGKLDIVSSIDANDFDYGATVTYTVPKVKVTVASDITMWSRRGYTSSMMNDDELIWNIALSRSFIKGALTTKIQAFDVLKQINSKRYWVNAQGRTESWYNNIPRYVMFSMAYKLTQKPKK